MDPPSSPCLCFPCILNYLGGYVWPSSEDQDYPELRNRGFSLHHQRQIAEEWYWVAVERETAIGEYLQGRVTFRDGCWWRPAPTSTTTATTTTTTATSPNFPSTPPSSSSTVSGSNT